MRRVKVRRRVAYLGQTGSFLGRAAGRAAPFLIIKKKKEKRNGGRLRRIVEIVKIVKIVNYLVKIVTKK